MRTKVLLTALLSVAPFALHAETLNDQMMHMHKGAAQAQMPAAAPTAPAQPSQMMMMQKSAAPAVDSEGGGAIPSLPLEVLTQNGVTYVNGGIGDEEMAELKAKASEFNLHVMISAKGGAYISDVALRVTDEKGNALVLIADAGPYFYAKLQPGHYVLETSTKEGKVTKKKLSVTGKQLIREHIVSDQ